MINVAVIGVGNMGRNHARVYMEIDDANLVSVSDTSKKVLNEFSSKFDCPAYRDYREMLRKEKVDAVSIVAPTGLHKKIALDCLDAGKHLLIEKPIADTFENALTVIDSARKKNLILMVGHIERFNPAISRLKELMLRKKLGDITSIVAKRVGIFPPQIKDANVIIDLAVHDIDVFNYLLGMRPVKVFARAGDAFKSGREDHAIITLSYGQATCVVQVNWITPVKVRELSVTGTKGYAEINYITQELRVFESNYERTYDTFGDFVVKFGNPKEINIDVEKREPLRMELEHFIQCVREGKEPIVTGEDALTALLVSEKAIESFTKGKIVEIENDS
jgi:UDP-N-acetylglucosamine 3-dehydrogenase